MSAQAIPTCRSSRPAHVAGLGPSPRSGERSELQPPIFFARSSPRRRSAAEARFARLSAARGRARLREQGGWSDMLEWPGRSYLESRGIVTARVTFTILALPPGGREVSGVSRRNRGSHEHANSDEP